MLRSVARPKVHDDALRGLLLDAASRLIADRGADAVGLREAARSAGTSTSAVYALFGSRDGLLTAIAAEAVRRFAGHLAAVRDTGDPSADLLALGRAYRASALADPHFYRVMFGAGPGRLRAGGAGAARHVRRAAARGAALHRRRALRRPMTPIGWR